MCALHDHELLCPVSHDALGQAWAFPGCTDPTAEQGDEFGRSLLTPELPSRGSRGWSSRGWDWVPCNPTRAPQHHKHYLLWLLQNTGDTDFTGAF